MRYARYAGSRLGSGTLAAHGKHRLMLLGSPQDRIVNAAYRGQTTQNISSVWNSSLL